MSVHKLLTKSCIIFGTHNIANGFEPHLCLHFLNYWKWGNMLTGSDSSSFFGISRCSQANWAQVAQ